MQDHNLAPHLWLLISRRSILSNRRRFATLWIVICLFGAGSSYAQTARPCATPSIAIVNGTKERPPIEGDYLVIEYNARSLQTFWYDYHDRGASAMRIDRNGSFIPVVDTKEKIAVHVCDLHFGDLLTVTTSPLGAPEGGADIRGTSPAPLPALTNTLDSLQSGATSGGNTPVGGLGYGATNSLTSTTVSGVSPGTLVYDEKNRTVTYTDANITASGEQIALMLYALQNNALAMIRGIEGTIAGWPRHSELFDYMEPGSVGYLNRESARLRDRIRDDSKDTGNAAAFDADMTAVQSLSAELSTLSSALSTQAFGARAVTIQTNYGTILGILDFIQQGLNCTRQVDGAPCGQFEKDKFEAFQRAYNNKIEEITGTETKTYQSQVKHTQAEVMEALWKLGENLQDIDRNTGELFNTMNAWNNESTVEQTDVLPLITGNALMRISIIIQRGYTPFVLANTPSVVPSSPTTVAAAPAPPAASTSTPPHAVKTILVEVHRVANFNLAGGVMLIHVPNSTYAVNASPTPATPSSSSPTGWTGSCNGKSVNIPAPPPPSSGSPTPPTYSCISATQKSPWQVAGMVGLTWYPWGRDYFPRHTGSSSYPRNLMPSLLLATSVTSLGNSMGAINWEPIGGIDVFAGVGSAHRNVLPNGVSTTTPLPSNYTLQTGTELHVGFTTGVAFDLGVFLQLFQKTSPAGMP